MSAESHAIAWLPVLDRIDQRLAESIAKTPLPDPAPPPALPQTWNPLARLEDHLDRVQQQLAGIAANAAETDASLASTTQELRQWLEHFHQSRQQLTEWTASLDAAVNAATPNGNG